MKTKPKKRMTLKEIAIETYRAGLRGSANAQLQGFGPFANESATKTMKSLLRKHGWLK